MKVYLAFVGCKLNLAEIEELGRHLQTAGVQLMDAPEEADLCIFNSCTVTGAAAGKSRRKVRQLVRRAPRAQIVVTGCHATQVPEELQAIAPQVLVVPNQHKEGILALVEARMDEHAPSGDSRPWSLRTRAFVKIQDGCDNHCAYCVICLARGPQHSRPPERVLEEVQGRVSEGYQEVVLTGVHVGAYGQDRGTDLARLVRLLLEHTQVRRLRLSSIEPHDLRPEFLDLWEDNRLCPHLHLPLQSGCDATLRRMGRRYTAEQFASLVAAAGEAVPDLAVTTDVIVGFPGETAQDFAETLDLVKSLNLARVHIFSFSPRPGTPAAEMPGQVPPQVIQGRHRALSAVAWGGTQRFAQRFLGRETEVLFEQRLEAHSADGLPAWSGLTGNYLRVRAESAESLRNQMRKVRLLRLLDSNLLVGEVV